MLLKSIKLENFRQFVDEQIDFSVDKEKNVTLVIGENGTGKTTFAQAFFWCLYGETEFKDKIILNRSIAERMLPDEKKTVRVELQLMHGSANYDIIRTQEYKKAYNGKVTPANTVLNISLKAEDGNTRYLKPLECETEIKKILPRELASYFFFDGERIEKMSKEIASGKKSSGFAEAVVGLTGLNATKAAINHLSPSKSNSVIGKLNESYVGDSSGKILALTKDIENIQNDLDNIDKRLSEIDGEIADAQTSKTRYEEEIKKYSDAEELQRKRETLERDYNAAINVKSQLVKALCHSFNVGSLSFISMSLVESALKIVSESDFGGKDIPEMHSKTIDYLIKRGSCICGTQLMEGTLPYKNVIALKDYLPPQSIGVTVGQFVKESKNMYSINYTDLFTEMNNQLSVISAQSETIDNIKVEIDQISDKLGGDDVKEQVNKLNGQINACKRSVFSLSNERDSLIRKQGSLETDKSIKENRRAELSLHDSNNQQIERLKAYAIRLYNNFVNEYKVKEGEVREKLEKSMNEIFKDIYNGGLSLTIDEKYNISVLVGENNPDVETSSAQSISVIFAFISAIIKMARENQEQNKDVSYSEPYPLVMDAPLSAFDKKRIKAICDSIPNIAEQVIIFIKDTDGDLAEEHLGSKVSKRHSFEKIDEFNTKLV